MIYKMHSAFALGLIALVAGTYLVTKMPSADQCCKKFAKVVGWFVIVTALLGLICTAYHGISYCKDGGCKSGRYGHGRMMRGKGMMKDCPMMKEMMKGKEHPAKTE